MKKENMLL